MICYGVVILLRFNDQNTFNQDSDASGIDVNSDSDYLGSEDSCDSHIFSNVTTEDISADAGPWWREFIAEEDFENLETGPKMVILMAILRECKRPGDKV